MYKLPIVALSLLSLSSAWAQRPTRPPAAPVKQDCQVVDILQGGNDFPIQGAIRVTDGQVEWTEDYFGEMETRRIERMPLEWDLNDHFRRITGRIAIPPASFVTKAKVDEDGIERSTKVTVNASYGAETQVISIESIRLWPLNAGEQRRWDTSIRSFKVRCQAVVEAAPESGPAPEESH